MEKQRISGTTGSFKRLLKLISICSLFIFSNSLFGQDNSLFKADSEVGFLASPEELKEDSINKIMSGEYVLTPVENQDFFTGEDIKFELIIPGFKPSEITMIRDENQEAYVKNDKGTPSFKSLKKYEDSADDGTKLQLWYSFNKKGNYSLLPIVADFNGEELEISFNSVSITEDPSKMNPEIVIIFSNGITITGSDIIDNPVFNAAVGKPLDFTIYVQYTTGLTKFNYDIPKDSIFVETDTYEIINGNVADLETPSNRLVPVASFQWSVPETGIKSLPGFKISATGYNGEKSELSFPDIKIKFVKNAFKLEGTGGDFLGDAFDESFQGSSESALIGENVKREISLEDCQKLADLYSTERNSFFSYFKAKNERKAFEEELGVPGAKNTTSVGLIYIAVIFIICGGVLLFFAIRRKQFFRIGVAALVTAAAISLLCFTINKRSKVYGISKGCTIYSIPEINAEASCMIGPGSLVLVTETTDIWYHVQQGEASGWSPKDNIIIVK